MLFVALVLVLLLLPCSTFAVPLAEWQPDEDKLLGRRRSPARTCPMNRRR